MKKTLLLLTVVLSFLATTHAQQWYTDLAQAQQKATELDRKIVLVFQGSDWCAPCIKLEREIWESEAFKTYANEHFVLLKADFPRKKENKLSDEQQAKNNKLAEKYNLQGSFPLVVILNASGAVLGTTGYKKLSPDEYVSLLSTF